MSAASRYAGYVQVRTSTTFAGVAATGRKFSACVMIFCYFKGMNKIAKNATTEMAIDSLLAIGACDK